MHARSQWCLLSCVAVSFLLIAAPTQPVMHYKNDDSSDAAADTEPAPVQRAASPAIAANPRVKAVVDAFVHSWRAYERYAWGKDELKPVSAGANQAWGGFAVTMVDGLDTQRGSSGCAPSSSAPSPGWTPTSLSTSAIPSASLK